MKSRPPRPSQRSSGSLTGDALKSGNVPGTLRTSVRSMSATIHGAAARTRARADPRVDIEKQKIKSKFYIF
jgi:hypothetical protein